MARHRGNAGSYPAKVSKTGVADVALSLAWAKGAGESAGSPARRQGASVGAGITPAAAIAPSNALQRIR